MTLTKSKYYFEALDYYPYNLAECMEALNYALSYDPEDADSLCLMGRIYSEQLKNYETAKQYFDEAMQCDIMNVNVPQHYIKCLLENEDFLEAEKLIEYSLKIKGIDKATIWLCRSLLSEMRGNFINALHFLQEAKKYCFNPQSLDAAKGRKKFLKSKIPKKSKKMKETN